MTATVVVPTVRGAGRIGSLLESLRRQTAEHQVLVVDNGSTDGTAGVLARYPEVESIRVDRNVGFGRAVNLAARGADGDSLVLVNDDCVCDDGFVERIAAPLGGETVMSAGVLRDHVDPNLIDSAGMELSRTLMVFDYLHGQPLEAVHTAPTPIGPSAAAAGFDRAAFLDEGGFDEALFAYWEDVDLVLRLRLGGGRCAFCPDARGTHAHSATLGSGSAAKNRLMGFGRGYVLRKWSVARGPRAVRVLAEEASLCAGQVLIDGNAVGLSARVRGARAARPVFGYPGELLRSYDTPSLRGDLRRRLARRRRLRRRREEPPREGLMRHLTPGRAWSPADDSGFDAALTSPPQDPIAAGRGNVALLGGMFSGSGAGASGLELLVDGSPAPVAHTGAHRGQPGFWWALLGIGPVSESTRIDVSLRPRDAGAGAPADLGQIEVVPGYPPLAGGTSPNGSEAGAPLTAICMATFEPPPDLFERQVESIRAQTHPEWICLISDDGSSADSLARIRDVIRDDPRFTLRENEHRAGFYGNFERVLAMVPAEASFVALADQDDRWHPEKLAVLLDEIGDRDLAYSDMRLVEPNGTVISDTYWTRRRNNYSDFASLLVGNTVTGTAMLFRSGLLDRALPFPERRSDGYHDHWIALNALAGRGISYVDRPLVDYVQHDGAAQGHAEANAGAAYLQLRLLSGLACQAVRAMAGRRGARGWADRFFGPYMRTVIWARVLMMRDPGTLTRRQRRVLEHISGSDGSPAALLWLAGRSLRPLWGANEAFGRELLILSSALWMHMLRMRLR